MDSSLSGWKIRDLNGKVLREFNGDDVGGYWLWLEMNGPKGYPQIE
jgi:hypothetical protein